MRYLYAIIRLFKCKHNWNILTGEPLYTKKLLKKRSETPDAYRYFMQCKRCGDIKSKIVKNIK